MAKIFKKKVIKSLVVDQWSPALTNTMPEKPFIKNQFVPQNSKILKYDLNWVNENVFFGVVCCVEKKKKLYKKALEKYSFDFTSKIYFLVVLHVMSMRKAIGIHACSFASSHLFIYLLT